MPVYDLSLRVSRRKLAAHLRHDHGFSDYEHPSTPAPDRWNLDDWPRKNLRGLHRNDHDEQHPALKHEHRHDL